MSAVSITVTLSCSLLYTVVRLEIPVIISCIGTSQVAAVIMEVSETHLLTLMSLSSLTRLRRAGNV